MTTICTSCISVCANSMNPSPVPSYLYALQSRRRGTIPNVFTSSKFLK